jgi:hypothetical protein
MTFGELHSWRIIAVFDHQLRVLAEILLRPDFFLNLPLKERGMNKWIFQPLL